MPKPAIAPDTTAPSQPKRRDAASDARRWRDADGTALHLDISTPSLWRGVRAGRLPAPVYPTPGCPRWDLYEVDEAVAKTRALPRDNLAERRTGRLAQLAATATANANSRQ